MKQHTIENILIFSAWLSMYISGYIAARNEKIKEWFGKLKYFTYLKLLKNH